MKGKYKNTVFPVCCPHCPEGKSVGVPENPARWLECLAYRDLREGSVQKLVRKDRCIYLRQVLERNKIIEKRLRKSEQ